MPFDLTTAKPSKAKGGFDLASARSPKVMATEKRAKDQKATHAATMQADRDENERSLGGVVHGTIEGLKELNPIDAAKDYAKGTGRGIATALENAEGTNSMDAITGLAAPMIEYPAAMAYGAGDALLRTGDYGASRAEAFQFMNDKLPEGAKRSQEVVGSIMKPAGDLSHTAGSGIGKIAAAPFEDASGAIEKNVGAVIEDIMGLVGAKKVAPEGTPGLKPGKPKRAPVTPGITADPAARARDAGYTIPASARDAQGKTISRVGSAAEGVSGRTSNQARADQLNDQRTLVGIRKDLNLPENAAVTEPAIKAIMDETEKVKTAVAGSIPALPSSQALVEAIGGIGAKRRNNPYLKETPAVAKLRQRLSNAAEGGSVETVQVMDAIQEFRDDARLLAQNAEKPEAKQQAQASREAADVLENALDEAITAVGRPDLIPSLKNMRVRRAKALQAQEAVSGKKRPGVALMDMKLAGEKLSGEMELAADVHRDLSPNGPLSVNKASTVGNQPGLIVETLQNAVRPIIQPVLNSERGQRFMFGERQPESLSPYSPQQFEVPEPAPIQGGMFGGPLEFEAPGGAAGGQMPSDARRLGSTIGPQDEALGPLLDLEGTEGLPGAEMPSANRLRTGPQIAGQGDGFGSAFEFESGEGLPGQMPTDARRLGSTTEHQNQIRMEDFELTPPYDRRVNEAPYTGIDRRVNGVPDLSAERQRVLDRPIGTRPNAGIADALMNDTGIMRGIQSDKLANRELINPGDSLPVGGQELPPTAGPVVSQFGDFERTGRPAPDMEGFGPMRQTGSLGDMIGNEQARAAPGELSFTKEDLFALGFSPEEIRQLLGEE